MDEFVAWAVGIPTHRLLRLNCFSIVNSMCTLVSIGPNGPGLMTVAFNNEGEDLYTLSPATFILKYSLPVAVSPSNVFCDSISLDIAKFSESPR